MPIQPIAQRQQVSDQGGRTVRAVILHVQHRTAAGDGLAGPLQHLQFHPLHVGFDESAGGQSQTVDRHDRDSFPLGVAAEGQSAEVVSG